MVLPYYSQLRWDYLHKLTFQLPPRSNIKSCQNDHEVVLPGLPLSVEVDPVIILRSVSVDLLYPFFCGLGCAARNICLWQVHILFMAFIPFPEHVQLDMYPSISIRICPPLFLCWTCCPPYPLFPSLSPLPYPLPWFLCFYLFKFYVSLMALGSRRFSLPHACAFNAVLFEILEWSIPCFTSGYRHVFVEEDAP